MSLRRAVVSQLKNHISALEGRVYQAYLTPANVKPPYCTVKLAGIRGSVNLPYAADQGIEVRLYNDQTCFIPLDALEQQTLVALNGIVITDDDTGLRYWIKWVPFGSTDYIDEEHKLIARLVFFETAVIHERG